MRMGSPINVAKETTSRLAQVHGRVGWDKRRIAAPAHHSSSISPLGGLVPPYQDITRPIRGVQAGSPL